MLFWNWSDSNSADGERHNKFNVLPNIHATHSSRDVVCCCTNLSKQLIIFKAETIIQTVNEQWPRSFILFTVTVTEAVGWITPEDSWPVKTAPEISKSSFRQTWLNMLGWLKKIVLHCGIASQLNASTHDKARIRSTSSSGNISTG